MLWSVPAKPFEEPMDPIWSVVVPAVAALSGSAIGSLFAPCVNWGIEKRREKLKNRARSSKGVVRGWTARTSQSSDSVSRPNTDM